MKGILVLLMLVFFNGLVCLAQFTDIFSDGDFTINPTWTGNTAKFEVLNEDSLHLVDNIASEAYLSVESEAISDAVWEFYVHLDFNPSSANFCKVYLVADTENLTNPINGYFVKIGGADDEVSLFRQDGTGETKIIDGLNDITDKSAVQLRIKVERDAVGNWTLSRANSRTGSLSIEGEMLDDTYLSSGFFGLLCKYTITRADKFYFDDFVVQGEPTPDTTPPILESIEVTSINSLSLLFSESLEKSSSENPLNFNVSNSIGNPSAVNLQASDESVLTLSFNSTFENGIENLISIQGVSDMAGNLVGPANQKFIYFEETEALPGDVIINEIFADTSPEVGLPGAEYLEIFNRSDKVFDLQNWTISDGARTANLPSFFLKPGDYLILCDQDDVTLYVLFGFVLGIPSFPTLNDGGDELILGDSSGQSIDFLKYDRSWYKDSQKDDGGFSLERINPNSVCQGRFNWRASTDDQGGTPGAQNSVFDNTPDLTGPILVTAFALSNDSLRLHFNEPIEEASVFTAGYQFSPILTIDDIQLSGNDKDEVLILLNDSIDHGIVYQISVENIRDCATNIIRTENSAAQFVLPEVGAKGDVILNEILFNPRTGGVDFVEVYNNSDKHINLLGWKFANLGKGDSIDQRKAILNGSLIIAPSEYRVLTEDAIILKSEYIKGVDANFYVTDLPTYPDDEGTVILLNPSDSVMDLFRYNDDFHFPIIRETEGVSLEKISFTGAGNDPNNWKSAATTEGFATPGYRNSQSSENLGAVGEVSIQPKTFSPDNDGIDDFAQINYSFLSTGNIANVMVYDVNGREVKELANNSLLGSKGFFTWDGTDINNRKARIGYYIVVFRTFNNSGEESVFKRTVVLATRF